MDTGASSHLADNTCLLTSFCNSSIYSSVFVGNRNFIPVTHTGHSFLHTSHKPLHLNHILVTPHIIKNLIYVCKFTRDNDDSVEFDAYGFSVKDYQTQKLLLRCDSTGDLYPVTQQPPLQTPVVLLSLSSTTWHRRLSHPGEDMLLRLESTNVNVVRSMWLFKHKFNADGSSIRDKARLVANGRSQQQASSSAFLQRIIASLHGEFAMTDLGSLNYFLGFPAQSVGSSNTNVLDLPCLLVLITRKSQADKHDDTSLIHYKNLASHLPRACLMLAQAGFPFVIVNTKEYHSECSGRITRIMHRTLVNSL
ncbi:ribonuclease H-like domain-containing protein [Tanacetum coccineum]|uniref:Ribonuclease H-like domain-containing protein n=1 Tax=Tanacetum coccineum TaxID=301880 RepID=A0ABQ5CDL3_9ASTR